MSERSDEWRRGADWYTSVRPFCLRHLQSAYDPDEALFSRQIRDARWAATSGAEAVTSTAACLIALSRAGATGLSIDPGRSVGAIANRLRTGHFFGAVGLSIWANAVVGHLAFEGFLDRSGLLLAALERSLGKLTTMELAWLVSGLLHQQNRTHEVSVDNLARLAVDALLERQEKSGLFVHAVSGARISQRLRRFVANFADQIYSVQALAFAALGHRSGALTPATRCADALLQRRGDLQQWWWHYDPRSGSVIGKYPVFAVHQHGMAPMAFLALAAAGASEYRDLAWPGLNWLSDNELGVDLVSEQIGTIWRDVHPRRSRPGKLWSDIRTVTGLRPEESSRLPTGLLLNRETRPYEWAWCLLAGEQMKGGAPRPHLV